MTQPCPGRCNENHRNNPAAMPRAVPGDPVWCSGCTGTIRAALRAMPDAYRALGTVPYLTPRPSSDEILTHVSGSRERPSPGPGVDLRHEMSKVMCLWEDDIRCHLRLRSALLPDGSGEALSRAVECLNSNFVPMMARMECAKDFGQEVLNLFRSALRMVKNGPSSRKLHIPCPRCGVRAMVQHEGVAQVPWYTECIPHIGGCGTLFSEKEMTWAAEVWMAVRR